MTKPVSPPPIDLRQRMIEDMEMRRFSRETQRNYLRDVGRFAKFLGRSPDTATADDVRQFQIVQRDAGTPVPTMNSIVSALRFFFAITVDRPDLARKLVRAVNRHHNGAPAPIMDRRLKRLGSFVDYRVPIGADLDPTH
ncbi:MAG: site-specific integrase [Acidocella sp.]|uniref:site-specific integrase n=1 Tax=Acidocella sp. TaxID=50710 RepID=UPI003FD744C4